MVRRDLGTIFRVVLAYSVFSAIWILLSDRAAAAITPSPQALLWINGVKGLVYTVFCAAVVALLLRRELRARQAVEGQGNAAERRFRRAIDSSTDPILVLDESTRVIDCNRAAETRYGYPRERLLEMRVQDLSPERLRGEIPGRMAAILQGEAVFEWTHVTASGFEVPVEIGAAVADIDGQKLVFSTARDISARKADEARIAALIRTYRVLGNVNQAIVRERVPQVLFEKVCQIAVNDGGFRLAWIGLIDRGSGAVRPVARAGYSEGYVEKTGIQLSDHPRGRGPVGRAVHERVHVVSNQIDTDPSMEPWREDALARGYCSVASFPLVVKDEVRGAFSLYAARPDFFDANELSLLDELAMDIAFSIEVAENEGRRQAVEQALRRSEALLKASQEAANVGGWEFDPATGEGTWTDQTAVIHDLDPRDPTCVAIGLSVYHGPHREAITRAVREAVEQGKPYDLELQMTTARANRRWVRVIGKPLQEGDRTVRVTGSIQDITAQKTMADELARHRVNLEEMVRARTAAMEAANAQLAEAKDRAESADHLKSAFLANMSHELRTPLNSVIGFTGILLQEIPGPLNAEQRKQLGMIRDSASHLLALICDVLDVSKIEAGQLQVERAPFDLRGSVLAVVSQLERAARDKGLALDARIDPTVGEVVGDRRRCEQVLFNLVGNAVKFTEAGSVQVEVHPAGGEAIQAVVRDTGIGIRADDLNRLFQPFFQVENGIARRFEGTGLGLSISRRLAELMGGRIWVESEVGVGSRFGFTIPIRGSEHEGTR